MALIVVCFLAEFPRLISTLSSDIVHIALARPSIIKTDHAVGLSYCALAMDTSMGKDSKVLRCIDSVLKQSK